MVQTGLKAIKVGKVMTELMDHREIRVGKD